MTHSAVTNSICCSSFQTLNGTDKYTNIIVVSCPSLISRCLFSICCIPSFQAPQMYQYISQGKYPRAKGKGTHLSGMHVAIYYQFLLLDFTTNLKHKNTIVVLYKEFWCPVYKMCYTHTYIHTQGSKLAPAERQWRVDFWAGD